ncbi:epimerase, partial [Bacillus subtilis]|nr:epimerase [Bacillus subtilis]
MNIAMTGGTAFLVQHLTGVLNSQGQHVYILSR